MARTNSANYFDEIIDAFEVDDNYEQYDRSKFKCPECLVKIAYNRGRNHKDPHFKNWKNISHFDNCFFNSFTKKLKPVKNKHIEIVTSTILPRAFRLQKIQKKEKLQIIKRRYFGRRSKKFLGSLASLSKMEISEIKLRTEDKETVNLKDLIMRQDEIIEKLDLDEENFICILKGFTTKSYGISNSIKIPMTYNGKFGNKNKFYLFMPQSRIAKNETKIETIENKLIYCYGIAEKNEFGHKIDLYSITHQILILE